MPDDADTSRLETFFQESPDALVVVDERGRIVRANDRVTDLFGYDPEELTGSPVERLVPEVYRDDHPEKFDSYMDDPTARPMGAGLELRARRKDGTTFPVDISLSPIERDGRLEVMAAVRDVTEQEKLRRKYRTLVEMAPDAMFIADAKTGELVEVNRQAVDLVGVPEAELVGEDQTALHPESDRERYRELFRRRAREGRVHAERFYDGDELYVQPAEGDPVPVEISAQVTQLDGREVVVGLFRDVSDRKAYEDQLRRQIRRLETLTHVISHDLRNPLNVAEGGVELVKETGDLAKLEMVENAHARVERIVEDVLTLIREGYEVESPVPIEVSDVVDTCWMNVRTHGATVDVVADGIVHADEKRIESLFENLFRNSVEHGGDDVRVRVGVAGDGFFVADDGVGIPEGDRANVFDPGWSTEGTGTGLGLNIVSEIAAAHGWDVAVTDGDDGGARFEFSGVETVVYDDSYES